MRRYELSDPQWARIAPLFPQRTRPGKAGRPPSDNRPIVNGILWVLHTGAPGATSPSATGRGRPSSPASTAGAAMAPGSASSPRCWTNWTTRARSTTTSGVSMARSIRASRAAAGAGKKGRASSRRLGGRKGAQMQEPPDHALGRSRGGFGTKVHLVCDSHGFIVAIHVTAGQAHESKAFEPTMARRLLHRRRGRGRWPDHLAGDKGYSYPGIRRWCRRRRIEAVIPTRKDQPRDEHFDKARYRRRNIIERVIGWYKDISPPWHAP